MATKQTKKTAPAPKKKTAPEKAAPKKALKNVKAPKAEKKDAKQAAEPAAQPGSLKVVMGWKPHSKDYPTLLTGKDPDGWFGLALGTKKQYGYVAYERKEDRDGLADAIVAFLETHIETATEDLEKTLEQGVERIEELEGEVERLTKELAEAKKVVPAKPAKKKKTATKKQTAKAA